MRRNRKVRDRRLTEEAVRTTLNKMKKKVFKAIRIHLRLLPPPVSHQSGVEVDIFMTNAFATQYIANLKLVTVKVI
jgi:hypothetical protein